MELPFGKHRGLKVSEAPRDYLQWLKEKVPLKGRLKEAVDAVLSGTPFADVDPDHRVHEVVRDAEAQLRSRGWLGPAGNTDI